MADGAADRVEIGFEGGQVIATRMNSDQLNALRTAVDKGDGWHDVSTADGNLAVDLGKVVFLRAAAPEHRIGFSTES
jgi:hypothetical protein